MLNGRKNAAIGISGVLAIILIEVGAVVLVVDFVLELTLGVDLVSFTSEP